MQAARSRRTYDYRIQEAMCASGDRDLFPELNIPRSTIRSWMHRGLPEVVTCDLAGFDHTELVAEIARLRHRTALLGAVVGLLIAMLRASKVHLNYERLPDGEAKRILLRAIERAGRALPLNAALRITRLSSSRYHSWCRAEAGCELDDQSSCPRVVLTRLTPKEVETMQEMVESDDHRRGAAS
jgi:putative transposase